MSSKTEKRRTGDRGERRAALWLFLHGYRILARNYTFGRNEIDIIAKKGRVTAFIEVKTRGSALTDAPRSAVSLTKQRNIISAAKHWRLEHDASDTVLRYDIAEVPLKGRINYIPNAFTE